MPRTHVTAVGFAALLALPLWTSAPAFATQAEPKGAAQAKVTDDQLEDRIEYRIETDRATKKYGIKVDVMQGVATLTGDVATAAQKAEAERLAHVPGVSKVENNLTVDAKADQTVADRAKAGLSKTGEAITDAWITTKVKWFYIGDDALKGSDINVDTKDHVVTLKGTVRNAVGRARAVELAKETDGVKNVVDQLTIKANTN